jgi:glucose-6-phosphate dehydrogenase assembly protein OpcA
MEINLMTLSSHFVSPAEIQTTLNAIWESFETKNVARACLFNLIFFTQKNPRTHYIERLAQTVVQKFPSRVIFVAVNQSSSEDYLKTAVSVLPSSKGEFDVACDYIHIETGGTYHERIPFVVLPQILPDLPVYLIWAEDPSNKDPICQQLEQFVDRIIFDSECTDQLARFATSALAHYEKSHSDIADLNWARIESWRNMLSMVFYTEDKLNLIKRAKQITVQYNSQETPFFCHVKIQATYLQAWLACQLGWQFKALQKKDTSLHFIYQTPDGEVDITLQTVQEKTLPPGLILSVAITTVGEERFAFNRQEQRIAFEHTTPSQCDLPSYYLFTKAESGHSLVKEICYRGTSEHYLKVLNLLKQMDHHGLC